MLGNQLTIIIALSLVFSLGHAPACADDTRRKLYITSTNAVDALNQLATQTDHSLLFDYDLMHSVKVSPIRGDYTLTEALSLMLVNTGYVGSLSNDGLIIITPLAGHLPNQLGRRVGAGNSVEEILVTGSNIRRQFGFQSGAPLKTVSNADIRRSGALDLGDVAARLTVNSGSITSQETGDLIGTRQFNLRALGFGSTLTLINGRRAGLSAVSDATGALFYDHMQLPLAMIERIDVQTDGASSIYGSDAVGGVVNIITRKGFEGLQLTAQYQTASNEAALVTLTSGLKRSGLMMNLYASAYTQTRNHRTDFDWLVRRIHGNGDLTQSRLVSSLGSPGSYRRARVMGTPSADPSSAIINEVGARFADPDCLAASGVLIGDRCGYNFADQVAPIPEERRFSIFSEIEYDFSHQLTLFAEASLSQNMIQRTQGPSSFRNGLVTGGDIFVPADHPFNFWVDDPNNPGNNLIYVAPADWDNDKHNAVDLACECRPQGFEANGFNNNPPFNQDINLDYLRNVVGFEWDTSDSWNLRANYIYSLSKRRFRAENNWNASRLNQAVLNGSFNPFGTSRVTPTLLSPKDGTSRAGNSRETIEFIQNIQRTGSRSIQQVVDITASGDLFSYQGNTVASAIGAQYRKINHRMQPDRLTAAGLGNNPFRSSGLEASQKVFALFGEVAIPLSNQFDIQLAIRHEDYLETVGSSTDPKLTMNWNVSDSISFSGSFGTAFRGPSIPQIGRSTSSVFIDDPVTPGVGNNIPTCGGAGQSNIAVVVTEGSDSLRPEPSRNLNLSGGFKPAKGLDVKLDYWRFSYRDLISADQGPQAIIENDCEDDGVPNDPRVIRTSDGQVLNITSRFTNSGSVVTDGFDLAASYLVRRPDLGNVVLKGWLSYVNKFEVSDANGNLFNGAGSRNFTNRFNSVPQLRANAVVNWRQKNHALDVGLRYIGSYKNDQNADFSIKPWAALDLQYSLDINVLQGQKTSLILGAKNIFNADPPSLGNGQRPAYDDRVHDIRGRSLYVAFRHKI